VQYVQYVQYLFRIAINIARKFTSDTTIQIAILHTIKQTLAIYIMIAILCTRLGKYTINIARIQTIHTQILFHIYAYCTYCQVL
jgi:hypothetical protein